MVYVDNRQDKREVSDKLVKQLENTIITALKEEEVNTQCEVSLVFVDNAKIREINNENRRIDRETDVLSFPILDYPKDKVFKEVYKDKKFDETYFLINALSPFTKSIRTSSLKLSGQLSLFFISFI